jgi:hypothetical protein
MPSLPCEASQRARLHGRAAFHWSVERHPGRAIRLVQRGKTGHRKSPILSFRALVVGEDIS